MKKILFMIIVGVLFVNLAYAADAEKINLSRSGGKGPYRSMHPVIKILSNKDIIVLWEEGPSERECNIVYRFFRNSTQSWEPPLNSLPYVAAYRRYSATFPQVIEDKDGVIHISYQDGRSRQERDAWYAYYKDGKWTKQMVYRTIENSAWPRININDNTQDLYITWHHEVLNTGFSGDSDIVYSILKKGSNSWTKPMNLSRTPKSITIHHSTTFFDNILYAIYMDGQESHWFLRGNYLDNNTNKYSSPITLFEGGYWPEIDKDSEDNLYALFTTRSYKLHYSYKPRHGNWIYKGELAAGGDVNFIGLKVAKNNVAYGIWYKGYSNGYLPLIVKFNAETKSQPLLIDDTARYPIRLKLDVGEDGSVYAVWVDRECNSPHTDACATSVWFKKISQPEKGATLKIDVSQDTILVDEPITFTGKIVSSKYKVTDLVWYNFENSLWKKGDTLTTSFSKPGTYEIHLYSADENLLMGHTKVVIDVIDAPYQPINTRVSSQEIKGFLMRKLFNKLEWENDERNIDKFKDNIEYFVISRKSENEDEWIDIKKINYEGQKKYETIDDTIAVKDKNDLSKYLYRIKVVANVDGVKKESKYSYFNNE